MEITHRVDRETGHIRQLVSAGRLRQILSEQGEDLPPPDDFDDDDEWDVGED